MLDDPGFVWPDPFPGSCGRGSSCPTQTMVMPPKKPVTQSVDTPPPDRSSAAFISYVYSHKRTAPLPETPRSTPLKGPKKTAS
jgi:hypothetical protein